MDQSEGDRTGRILPREGGVGLLVIDRDRFGSLSIRNPDRDGSLVSTEIRTDGPVRLEVNAEGLGPDSPLRLELVDWAERPLPGYAGGQAAVLTRSGLHLPATWGGARELPAGRPFRIRASFEGPERGAIRLYALYLGQ